MKTSDFDYLLPPEKIAQTPIEPRDQSRLMVLNRSNGSIDKRRFWEIADYLQAGDVLVFNDSRVIPARLKGRGVDSGSQVEILLLRRLDTNTWQVLVKPGRRAGIGAKVDITDDGRRTRLQAEITGVGQDGIKIMTFSDERLLSEVGKVPLPPYIHTPLADPERYQTVYARVDGSVAAPTAGLHFTPELMAKIGQKGVHCLFVTLHIGLDTFRPVREENPLDHPIYQEYGVLSQEVASQLSQARAEGQRVICVGTTTMRLIEQAAQSSKSSLLEPFTDWVSLFILPGYQFRVADGLITNFHLPKSTLIMLITAFADKDLISQAYREAIASNYRFYSFGDAMLIL
ncbi:MAG: tRNA preQ1(34) S-adenosylmethionine ribosyltransferase-isomerase QueA [Dehalococcoidia bacterium]|nr:MAG: tRNA preQ1(34) S-adenosylmethionine ribosyltransferase-isomerase QueA [Dehalococcoidia bacterium]